MQMKDSKALWLSCLKYIRENVPAEDYDSLFAHVSFEKYIVAERRLILQSPSDYICDQIEKNFLDVFRTAIYNTFGKIHLGWDIVVVEPQEGKKGTSVLVESPDSSTPYDIKQPALQPKAAKLPPIDSQLNTSQTFRTFIEGESNKLSRSIGLSVAEHPNTSQFNPMFIFGPSGCGKTHLVNAIGNRCKELYPDKRVLYVSARTFTTQYSQSTLKGKVNDFIAFYQTIDMLIVDDVQEWVKATGTQDTFFHIFNHLHRNGRRIILVSDRALSEMEGISKRLITRFGCGMTAEMDKPNYQLCVDILKKKAVRDGISIPDDVVDFIASTANGSVRYLEGILNSLMAYSIVYHSNLNMSLVERVVKRAVKVDDSPLTVDDIMDKVCNEYEVTHNLVKGRSRKKEVVVPRQIVMYLAEKYTKIPVSRIGSMIGSRDHSTVLHSIAKVKEQIQADELFRQRVERIEKQLQVKDKKS